MNIDKKIGNIMSQNIPQSFPKSQEKIIRTENNIYDDEFVSLINSLNESIKEYYKVSHQNILEVNSFISYYQVQNQSIQMLINEIINTNQYERISETFDSINKMEDIMTQLKMNSNSTEKNLNLFFEDAKILFKKMKMKRNQKLTEINNNNINNPKILKESIDLNSNSTNLNNRNNLLKQNSDEKSLNTINKVYSQIVTLVSKFSEYNYIIGGVNIGASNNFTNLQNILKKNLNILMNLFKNYFNTNKNITKIYETNSHKSVRDPTNRERSKSQCNRENKEIEKLKVKIQLDEKKIKELTNKLNMYSKYNTNPNVRGSDSALSNFSKTKDYEMNTSNLSLKIIKLEKLIQEKDNLINSLKNTSNVGNNNFNNNLNNILLQIILSFLVLLFHLPSL